MCGIVMAHDFTGAPVNNGIMQQFDKQRSRGTEGFGLFDGQELNIVREASEDKILKWLCKYDSNLILFHHRWPTSTINVKRAAHPFSTKDFFKSQYIMVHNGVISNAKELREQHKALGIEYQSVLQDGTFNDSEALLWELALTLEGRQEQITAKGSIAFVCIKLTDGVLDKMYFGRNSSPLKLYRDKCGIALSSEGEGEFIDTQKLYTFNYKLKRLTSKDFIIPSNYVDYTKNTPAYNYEDRQVSDWLSPNSQNKWNQWLNKNLIDYDRDGTPIFALEPNRDTQVLEPVEEDDDELYEAFLAEERLVQEKLMYYLTKAKGHFETAYWYAETDYYDAQEKDDRELVWLLEEVMEQIESDEEYINEHSISTIWSVAWAV